MPLPHDPSIYVFLSKTFSDAPGLARPIRWHDFIVMRAYADTAMVPVRRSRRKRPQGTPARGARAPFSWGTSHNMYFLGVRVRHTFGTNLQFCCCIPRWYVSMGLLGDARCPRRKMAARAGRRHT